MSVSTAPTEPERTVVAAVIRDTGGRCLIARRPPGRSGAGLYEFPGGKLEAGEDERGALIRELREELGIMVTACHPCPYLRAANPPGIRLSFWEVTGYEGSPRPLEGQTVTWRRSAALAPATFLPADGPVVARLRLPPLYLISHADALGEEVFLTRLEQALETGVRLVQLREPWPLPRLLALAARTRRLCHHYEARLLLNADPAVAAAYADGVHLPAARLMALTARPLAANRLVAASCHDSTEVHHAAAIGCDFAVLSPVLPTASHPGAATLGWQRFRELAQSTLLPLYALGGMTASDWVISRAALAQGVALRSAALAG